MLILIEGLDRTGKTTLAETIQMSVPDAAIYHFGAPNADAITEYVLRAALDAHLPGERTMILDRGHLGEAVWPSIFGRESKMTWRERQWIELFYMSRGAVYVHAKRDLDNLHVAFMDAADRGEPEPLPIDKIEHAAAGFDVALEDAAPPVIAYDHADRERLIPAILRTAENCAEFARPGIEIEPRWIGNPRPTLLYDCEGDGPLETPAADSAEFDWIMGDAGDEWRRVAILGSKYGNGLDLWNYLGRPARRDVPVEIGSAS